MVDGGQLAALRAQLALKANDPPAPPIVIGSEVAAAVPFTFLNGTMVFGLIAAGSIFTCVQIIIDTAFDDPAATIAFGFSGSLGRLLSVSDTKLNRIGQYGSDELVRLNVGDLLLLTVQAAGSTQGEGRVFYRLLQP